MYSMVPSCFLHIRTSVVNQIITVPQLLPRGLNLTKSSTNNVTKLNPQHKQHHVIVGHHMWSNVTWTEGRPVSQIGSKKGPCRFYLKFHEAPNQPCTASRTLSFEIHDCRLKKWSSVVVSGIREKTPWKDFETDQTEGLQGSMMAGFLGVLHEVLSLKSFQKRSKKYHCWISYHDLFCTWLL